MSNLKKTKISSSRQKLKTLIKRLDIASSKCLFTDPLIKGIPHEVLRKCGKKNCACATDQNRRHGPYKVISVYKNGRQRQVSIRKSKEELWNQAVHYQSQIRALNEAKEISKEIENIIQEMIQLRLKEFPDE